MTEKVTKVALLPATICAAICACLFAVAYCGSEASCLGAASAPADKSAGESPRKGEGITESIHRAALTWLAEAESRVARMVPAAERVAKSLIKGGKLYAAGNGGFCEELVGRAGGFMFIETYTGQKLGANDVILLGRFRPNDPEPYYTKLIDIVGAHGRFSKGTVVHFAGHDWPQVRRHLPLVSPRWSGRLHMIDTAAPSGHSLSNLCVQQLAAVASVWAFQGEVIAAATRKGKMFATWPSMLEPNSKKLTAAMKGRNLVAGHKVPAIKPGRLGREYLKVCRTQIGEFLKTQPGQVRLAAGRLAACMKRGGLVWLVSCGHVHDHGGHLPKELDRVIRFGRSWQFTNFRGKMPPEDMLLWIGYLHYPRRAAAKARRSGSQAVILSVDSGPPDDSVINIRSCWKEWDSAVDLPGYPTRVLASSGTVTTVQWYSILGETLAAYKPAGGQR